MDPRIGIVVLLNDRLLFRAGAGRAFRVPSFDELAPSLSGNPSLLPESKRVPSGEKATHHTDAVWPMQRRRSRWASTS